MTDELLPADYQTFLHAIKTRVQQAQLQAVFAVNKELILLYWHIGKKFSPGNRKRDGDQMLLDGSPMIYMRHFRR